MNSATRSRRSSSRREEGWPAATPANADVGAVPAPIVFIGGTGRSGTHVLATLLGHHSAYADVPIEARFHAKPQGIPDLLAGEVSVEEFVRKLRRFWWYRVAAGQPLPAVLPRLRLGRDVRGLHKIMDRRRLERALLRFERRWPRDHLVACRRLFIDLLWPVAARAGKPGLVEMTTSTTMHASTLIRLFPEARFIHSIRDGRDSGASKVSKRQRSHHPRDAHEGFEWWLDRLERIERGTAGVPADRILHLSLDLLVADDRERSYARLLRFLGLEDEEAPRTYFEAEVSGSAAHRERWREGLSSSEQEELTRRYAMALDAIAERGFASAAPLREAYERLG